MKDGRCHTITQVNKKWLPATYLRICEIAVKKFLDNNKLVSSRENLSTGFPNRWDTNRPAQLMRLARVLKFWLWQAEILYHPGREQQRRWSDCVDAQADLRLCCSHKAKPELFFLSVAWPTGVQLLVFFCTSDPVVLFDTPGISRCRSQHVVSVESSSLFHHSIYLWFVSHDDPLMG